MKSQAHSSITDGRLYICSFVTFDDDVAVEAVFGAGRMHTIGGKQVEVKPATPRGSGPAGVPAVARFPMVVPPRGMGRGFGDMGAMGGFPGAPYAGAYGGMMPYGGGGRMQPMVRLSPPLFVMNPRKCLDCVMTC